MKIAGLRRSVPSTPRGAASHRSKGTWNERFGATHFLVLGLLPIDVALPNNPVVTAGCRLLVPLDGMSGYLGIAAAQVGADVSWEFPLPELLAPTNLYFQDRIFNPNLQKFFSTQRLEVPLTK